MMGWLRFFAALLAFIAAEPCLAQPAAESYPARPVRMIIGYTPGGSADITALVAEWRSLYFHRKTS